MSIASEITSMGENLKKDYQSIANLGADLTNVDKNIENIAELLDGVYDHLPKTSFQEGTSVTIENGLKGKIDFDDGKVGYGQASQESTNGYNLIDVTSGTITTDVVTGVTASMSGDVITLNGTRGDGNTDPKRFIDNVDEFGTLTSGRTYRMSLNNISGTFNGGIAITFRDASGQIEYIQTSNGGTSATRELTFSRNVTYIRIVVTGSFTASNFKFQLMLQDTTEEKPYEPYTGGYASPSPNWEQEVKCVAGRNKWNGEYTKNYIDANGDLVSSTNTLLTDYIELDSNITISAKENMYIVGVAYYNSSKTFISREQKSDRTFKNITYSTPINTKYVRIYVNLAITDFTDDDVKNFKIQIEQGSTATPYTPYNTIEEVVRGINYCNLSNSNPESTTNINISINDNSSLLFDSNGETVQDSKNIFDSFTLPKVATLPKGDYTFAIQFIGDCNVSVNTIASYLKASARVDSGTYATCTNVGTITNGTIYATRFTLTEEKDIYLQVFTNSQNKKFTNTQMRFMIYSGSYPTTTDIPNYEPYHTPITYPISLGSNKFYNIGDYADELLYDVDEDKVYKNEKIKEYVLSDLFWAYNSSPSTPVPRTTIRTIGITESVDNFLSNIFDKDAERPNTIKKYDNVTTYISMADSITGITSGDTDTQKLQKMLAILTNKNANLLVIKDTSTEIEITDTTLVNQVKALYNAHSLNGTTILESNGDLPMIIKVRALKGE